AALVGAIVWAWNESEVFRGVITAGMEAVKAAFISVYDVGKSVFEGLADIVSGAWKQIKGVFTFDGDMIAEGVKQQLKGVNAVTETLKGAPTKFAMEQVAAMKEGYSRATSEFRAEKDQEAAQEAADNKRREMALAGVSGGATGVIDAKSMGN